MTKNHTNIGKTGTRVEDGQKVKAEDPRVNNNPSSTQTWQVQSLDYIFEEWQNLPLEFGSFTYMVLVYFYQKKSENII